MRTIEKAQSIAAQAHTLMDNVTGYVSAYDVSRSQGRLYLMDQYKRGYGQSKTAILDDIRKLRRDLLSLARDIEAGEPVF